MQCFGILFKVLLKVISETFPKKLFLSALRMEQYTAPLVQGPVHHLPLAKIRLKYYV